MDTKIRISVGNQDNYFLNYAVELLETEMKKLGAKFEFEYSPGDHFTIETEEYKKAGHSFLEKNIWNGLRILLNNVSIRLKKNSYLLILAHR